MAYRGLTVEQIPEFLMHKGFWPVKKVRFPNGDIYLADTDLETDKPGQYPFGYYQTLYILVSKRSNGKVDIKQWLEFDAFHDMQKSWSLETKRNKRIETTLAQAKHILQKLTRKREYHA